MDMLYRAEGTYSVSLCTCAHQASLCKSLQSLCVDHVRVHKTPVTTDYTVEYVSKAGISTKECVDIMSETYMLSLLPRGPGTGLHTRVT